MPRPPGRVPPRLLVRKNDICPQSTIGLASYTVLCSSESRAYGRHNQKAVNNRLASRGRVKDMIPQRAVCRFSPHPRTHAWTTKHVPRGGHATDAVLFAIPSLMSAGSPRPGLLGSTNSRQSCPLHPLPSSSLTSVIGSALSLPPMEQIVERLECRTERLSCRDVPSPPNPPPFHSSRHIHHHEAFSPNCTAAVEACPFCFSACPESGSERHANLQLHVSGAVSGRLSPRNQSRRTAAIENMTGAAESSFSALARDQKSVRGIKAYAYSGLRG